MLMVAANIGDIIAAGIISKKGQRESEHQEMQEQAFWQALAQLVAESEIVIDRPKGSAHPRYPDMIYPLDYGYLQGTNSGDGDGIDIWRGSARPATAAHQISGIVLTVDLLKRDSEIKILLDCTEDEQELILKHHNSHQGGQAALLVRNQYL